MAIKLEIEGVFNVTTRGKFVSVRRIDPEANFYITNKSFLGGVELVKYFDIPRSLDENGNQRQDVVVFQLKNPDDAGKLIPKTIVEIVPGDDIHFLVPWYKFEKVETVFAEQLCMEVSPKHVLFNKKVKAIAKRQDNDDILFEVLDDENKFAVVHLTWKQRNEEDPRYPKTRLFKNWIDLYNEC